MNIEDLKSIGISAESLGDRVVTQAADQLLNSVCCDEDGEPISVASRFQQAVQEAIKKRIDESVAALMERHVLPSVAAKVEGLTLQETSKWGEKTGKTLTFIEYLVDRADQFINEQVDSQGRAKREADSYSWTGKTTRIAYLVHSHLQYSIETAMTNALADANSRFANGLNGACKLALEEATKNFKVQTTIKG